MLKGLASDTQLCLANLDCNLYRDVEFDCDVHIERADGAATEPLCGEI